MTDWTAAAAAHLWLPYTQMKTAAPPLPIVRADGAYLHLADGRRLLDGVGAWWTAVHGHNHPDIRAAIARQLETLPHAMLGGLVHEQAALLSARLARLLGGTLSHVFFSDSGSVAVEVAMKMAVQAWLNRGERGRTRFVAFRGGYHGDTLGTMAVCDPDEGMHTLFAGVIPNQIITDLPDTEDRMAAFEALLDARGPEIAGVIVEPLVQGAGGMLMHTPATLARLTRAAQARGLPVIMDEIFTGFGRTGTLFAHQAAGVMPDIITLGKALTGGFLPLAATVASRAIYEAFLSDDPGQALMHGPTFMGNALGCAAANASLALFDREPRLAQVAAIAGWLEAELAAARGLPNVAGVRVMGAIGAIELTRMPPLQPIKDRFVADGLFLRPFGRILYTTPGYTWTEDEVRRLARALVAAAASSHA